MTKVRRCNIGRYYNGDIEGKFWFGIQSSTAADRFGVIGEPPNCLEYYFDEDDLQSVENELENIKLKLGDDYDKLKTFFDSVDSYNDETLQKAGLLDVWNAYSSDFADYRLGIKIRDCIKEHGECHFTAEL